MYRYVVLLIAMLLLGACSSDKDENDNSRSGNTTPDAGVAAPDFTLASSDGEMVSLADYEQPVLLFFHMAEG
ncbi:MAG TPA: hypothetical protein VHP83_18065 [Aggregatilineaceae bacterium]|nr:hypothetical protein [Aggregatilineaceae bacterium]